MLHPQQTGLSDVNSMGTRACAGAVVFKIAIADQDFGSDDAGGEDAVLVVDEARPFDSQVSAFAAYPGSVQITDTRPLKRDVSHRNIVAARDEKALAPAYLAGDQHPRVGSHSFDGEVVRAPDGTFAIRARCYCHPVAITGVGRGFGQALVG